MKQKIKLGLTVLAAAAALGLAAPAFAQDATTTTTAAVPQSQNWGLLGSSYGGVKFTYDHIDSTSPSEWRGFALDFNKPVSAGLDFNFAFDWKEADDYRVTLRQEDLVGGLTLFSALDWGKPYAQALAGWEWRSGDFFGGSSFVYTLGVGVEFQATSAWVLTPYVNFVRATSFDRSEFHYGVKTAYRLNPNWSLTASAEYLAVHDGKDGTGYSLGVNYHY